MIYFDCVNKTVLFLANSSQTIHRKNPTKSSTNSETIRHLNHTIKPILFHVDLSNVFIINTLS